jgi:type IV pilus assembly protein PilY1
MDPPAGYMDSSYAKFTSTSDYLNRGMAYVGANDGMLHAFKAGKLNVATNGDQKASLIAGSAGVLGNEEWAFIPKNAIPYLTYLTDPGYPHLYFVDGTATLFDASINSCGGGNYWDCPKDYAQGANWRSVLVGGMGLGGASKNSTTLNVPNSVNTPLADVGYSSYFALDITDQTFDPNTGVRASSKVPTLLWEFAHEQLGYALSGPAIVRIAATTGGVTDNSKNGRWFAVFGSGPTGPIDPSACQFKGKSDQNLKLFVVDLKATGAWTLNTNYWIIDSGIPYAFAGSISGGVIDADRWKQSLPGNYQDDAVYLGYVRNTASNGSGTWTEGGVARLLTKESLDPSTWTVAKVIDGVGAVTTNIAKLQDRKNHNLWLYFGSGRYFYNQDDMGNSRKIYGIKEPCYTQADAIRKDCSASDQLNNTLLTNQTTSPSSSLIPVIGDKGWYIQLADQDASNQLGAERSVTDAVAMTNGAVFFTTYKPTGDPCQYGGKSRMWAVTYDTGGQVPARTLKGKALVQISTGEFKEIDLATAFTAMGYRAMGNDMIGKPPGDPPPIVTSGNLKPLKKILHIEEH